MKVLCLCSDSLGAGSNVTGLYPPLGLAYLAAVLKSDGHEVKLLDARLCGVSSPALKNEIKKISPSLVLLSAMTPSWTDALSMAYAVKDVDDKIIVGLGGPHVSAYPIESLRHKAFDFGVRGEGEVTVRKAARLLENGQNLESVPGCVQRRDEEVVVNPSAPEIEDLDSIPYPDLSMLPYREYAAFSVRNPFFTMITSRGCPYTCGFCAQGHLGRYRFRSAGNVVDEMEILVKKYGIREIVIFDETFALEKDRAADICAMILGKKLSFKWDIRTRVDLLDACLLDMLKKAGCSRINVGIESGDTGVLRRMEKGIDPDLIREKVCLAKSMGFELRGYFMLGYPGETVSTMRSTVKFALSLPLDWASFTVTLGLPGTKIYEEALKQGRFTHDYWSKYAMDGSRSGRMPYFPPPGMSEDELLAFKRGAYLRFYLRIGALKGLLFNSEWGSFLANIPRFAGMIPDMMRSILKV